MEKPHSQKFLQRRKFIVLLPLLVLPFIILLFFILGGGKGLIGNSMGQHAAGLNVKLPDAHFKKGADKSKLALYEDAGKDSALLKEKIRNDPYYLLKRHNLELPDSLHSNIPTTDENEAKIMENISKLKFVISRKKEAPVNQAQSSIQTGGSTEELRKLMANLGNPKTHNPELDQLTGMLDKAMALKYPELMRDSLSRFAETHKQISYPVSFPQDSKELAAFEGQNNESSSAGQIANRFYSIAGTENISDVGNAIEAVIAEDQKILSGSKVKIRLLNDVQINGHLIPKNQFIYGNCSFGNQRVKIQISSIYSRNSFLPVSLEVYDLDGMPGISVSEGMVADATKESGNQALNTLGVTSLDPSLGAQAAGAGIQAAKSLIGKKVRTVRIPLRAGYNVLLRNTQN